MHTAELADVDVVNHNDQQTEEMIHEWQVISVITDQGPYSQNIVSYH